MKNWENYLAEHNYSWKELFLFLVDEGHMHNLVKDMMDCGELDELTPDETDNMVKYLCDKMRWD